MMKNLGKEILIGDNKLFTSNSAITGSFEDINGESFYKIANYHQMDPFFMTIVSNSDHWMFISSNGALTAGRKNPDNALFPYYTVDKIQDSAEISGSKSILLVQRDGRYFLWEPFSDKYNGVYNIQRNIYKSVYGNKILFEEVNNNLGVSFSYLWMNSDKYGFIKKSAVANILSEDCTISLLDGIQNILPAGIDRSLQLSYSNLVDAYKKNELITGTSIGLFMLSSVIVDKAEPSESLNTTVVWSDGLENAKTLLSTRQVNNFRAGLPVETETDIRAARGAYFLNAEINLAGNSKKSWHIVADVNKNAGYLVDLKQFISNTGNIAQALQKDVDDCTSGLINIVAAADGLQLTADKLSESRHMSNVLFNVMRGGIFDDHYAVSKQDLLQFISGANKTVYNNNSTFFDSLDSVVNYPSLLKEATAHGDKQLLRLCYEYMPLSFSRRHGDPSRPWNLFSIEMKKEDGKKNLNYQGNWRDIFQNWEALALSFPSFTESMICKFLNASTADGYNPYRITRQGIDWEAPDPHDPWAHIGYWGDHQIIYLLKFLEISKRYHPGVLHSMLSENMFAYANIPYRIKPYNELIKNPFETIVYDFDAEKVTKERVSTTGSDGKLIWDNTGSVMQVNFTEKLLATVLAKLSNFIPEAGIWLNTQRPEWNDANNALVGNGVSMVTLYYLRRMQAFCLELFAAAHTNQFELSEEIATFFHSLSNTFVQYETLLSGDITDTDRKTITDALGSAGSNYRLTIYRNGFSGKKQTVSADELISFFTSTLKHIDHSINKNKRTDNLYHAYNLITIKEHTISIRYLYEMLEGQVAVLSAGVLNTQEVIDTLDALKASAMFRKDQYSFMLYPDRQLPRFTEKNNVPAALVNKSQLLTRLIQENNSDVIYKDAEGVYHFNGNFRNAADVKRVLDAMRSNISIEEKEEVLQIFEKVFDHQSFTGRSGTFYGFEGLGCIYWHMVSKLLLAISESYFHALHSKTEEALLGKLVQHYFDVRAGIGLNKSPELYGAFPTDAYSHTPGYGGAKQPGMTGQVKEDVISRFGELGVMVAEGKIVFNPGLLRKSEFLTTGRQFQYRSVQNETMQLDLTAGTLVFTCCQVPIVYHLADKNSMQITKADGSIKEVEGLEMNVSDSNEIFNRTGMIKQADVYLMPRLN